MGRARGRYGMVIFSADTVPSRERFVRRDDAKDDARKRPRLCRVVVGRIMAQVIGKQ